MIKTLQSLMQPLFADLFCPIFDRRPQFWIRFYRGGLPTLRDRPNILAGTPYQEWQSPTSMDFRDSLPGFRLEFSQAPHLIRISYIDQVVGHPA